MPLGRFTAGRLEVDLPRPPRRPERPGALAYRPGRPQMSGMKRLLLVSAASPRAASARLLGQAVGA